MGDHGDALVDGERRAAPPADHRQRLLGPDAAELLAPLDAEQQVGAGVGHAEVGERVVAGQVAFGVVAVDPARLRAAREPEQGHRLLGPHQVARHDQDQRRRARPVGLEASPVDLVETLVQRLDQLAKSSLVEAGDRGVPELDEPVGLVAEGLGSVVRQGRLLRVAVGGQRTAGDGSSLRVERNERGPDRAGHRRDRLHRPPPGPRAGGARPRRAGDDPPAGVVRRARRPGRRRRARAGHAHRPHGGRRCGDLPGALARRPGLRAQGRRGGPRVRAGRCQRRGPADRLHGRARGRERRPLPAPALAPRGRRAARGGRGPGHGAARGDRGRRRRHLVGAHPAAGEEPAGDGGAALGVHPHPADRPRRRGPLPRRRRRRARDPRPGLRDRRSRPADLPRDAPGRVRGRHRSPGPDRAGAGADAAALVVLAGAGDRRRRHHRPQPDRLDGHRGPGHRRVHPRDRARRPADVRRGRAARARGRGLLPRRTTPAGRRASRSTRSRG